MSHENSHGTRSYLWGLAVCTVAGLAAAGALTRYLGEPAHAAAAPPAAAAPGSTTLVLTIRDGLIESAEMSGRAVPARAAADIEVAAGARTLVITIHDGQIASAKVACR